MAQPSPVERGGEPLRPDEVRRQVRVYLAEYFMTGDLPDEKALLVDDLGADSLDLLQVVHTLNDIFDIDLDADALPQMLTVGGACDAVCACVAAIGSSLIQTSSEQNRSTLDALAQAIRV